MAAKDLYHDAVRRALEKDGWTITDDPLKIKVGDITVSIDLGAENLLAAEKQGRKIAVEIKSFLSGSPLTDFHAALGQLLNYRLALATEEVKRTLYLAVPQATYDTFFKKELVRKSVRVHKVKLVVYNPIEEEIVSWKS